MACTVPGCGSRAGSLTDNNTNISFHRFPSDLDLKKSWIKNVRKGDKWSPSQYTRICSLHFDESCFREGYVRKTLHSYAVPTIFPNHPLSDKPKLPKKRKLVKYGGVDALRPSTSTAAKTDAEPLHDSLTKIDVAMQTDVIDIDAKLRTMTNLANRYKVLAARRGRKLKNLQRKCSRHGIL